MRTLSTGSHGFDTESTSTLPSSAVLDILSGVDDERVQQIHLDYEGSKPQCAMVDIQGVPTHGVVDTGADKTIIGGDLFKRVASVAKLKRKDLKKADRVPKTYDQKPFSLDGRMDFDISFNDATVRTLIYIKMDATTPLLLSEGVCRQLGIIAYHPDVLKLVKGNRPPSRAVKREEIKTTGGDWDKV